MYFFAETMCILKRLYARLCENIDHLSPVEAGARTELGKNPTLQQFSVHANYYQ